MNQIIRMSLLTAAIGIHSLSAMQQNPKNMLWNGIRTHNLDMVREAVALGADVNVRDEYQRTTPIHIAIKTNNLPLVQYLVEHGANINARDIDRDNALDIAIWRGNLPLVQYLIEHGADMDADDFYGCRRL